MMYIFLITGLPSDSESETMRRARLLFLLAFSSELRLLVCSASLALHFAFKQVSVLIKRQDQLLNNGGNYKIQYQAKGIKYYLCNVRSGQDIPSIGRYQAVLLSYTMLQCCSAASSKTAPGQKKKFPMVKKFVSYIMMQGTK